MLPRTVVFFLSGMFGFRYRSLSYFTLLALVSVIGLATLNLYHMESVRSTWTPISANSMTSDVPGGGATPVATGCEEIPLWQSQLYHRATLPPTLGRRSKTKKFLAIGISSVYREENYLHETLKSLTSESDPEERSDAVIVIYLADTDQEKKDKQLRLIERDFQPHLESGFFQVIQSGPDVYPPMHFALTKRTFNDSVGRVLWRTKQVIDFAFLFSYSKTLSDYYLVIEDDIISSTQYITAIKDFIASRGTHHWIALQFSGFLGIGLLFRSPDLNNLIRLLIMFHQEQPVDMLMRHYIALQVPEDSMVARRIPSIFQHIGWKSTLPNKVQKLKDSTFDIAKRRFKNHNPSADIITTMKVYNDFIPEYAYRAAPGFFWGITRPNDTYDIIFPMPVSVSRVVFITGVPSTKNKQKIMKDYIQDGDLLVSNKFQKVAPNNSAICDNFLSLKKFKEGEMDFQKSELAPEMTNVTERLKSVQCIRVKIGPNQKSWVIMREIQVFVGDAGDGDANEARSADSKV